jgi:hypothetical protein
MTPYQRTGSDPVCTFTGYLLGTKRLIAVASWHCSRRHLASCKTARLGNAPLEHPLMNGRIVRRPRPADMQQEFDFLQDSSENHRVSRDEIPDRGKA